MRSAGSAGCSCFPWVQSRLIAVTHSGSGWDHLSCRDESGRLAVNTVAASAHKRGLSRQSCGISTSSGTSCPCSTQSLRMLSPLLCPWQGPSSGVSTSRVEGCLWEQRARWAPLPSGSPQPRGLRAWGPSYHRSVLAGMASLPLPPQALASPRPSVLGRALARCWPGGQRGTAWSWCWEQLPVCSGWRLPSTSGLLGAGLLNKLSIED